MKKPAIFIVGGGIAGLTASILLVRAGYEVTLAEKKHYPFHRVCGEYLSNEAIPFLRSVGIELEDLQPSKISRLAISSPSGKLFQSRLDLGGTGVSRYEFDDFLYRKAVSLGVNFLLGEKVAAIAFRDNAYEITLSSSTAKAGLVIAAHGKRSNLDQKMGRSFFYKRSPYAGVKYHIHTEFPVDLIQLDNFEGGYCGIQKIEANRYCLCYLAETRMLKKHGSIQALEAEVLYKNPQLKRHFTDSEFLYERPEVINEISFEQKSLVEEHVFFCGDAAGMITPLCGNGMAMAIHSAKLLAEEIIYCGDLSDPQKRETLENAWISAWNQQFRLRLQTGRYIQNIFGSKAISELSLTLLKTIPGAADFLIKKTHGKVF